LSSTVREVFEQYMTIRGNASSGNVLAFCPLHGESPGSSTPSLSLNLDTGQWHCFAGCGGGSMRSLLVEVASKPTAARIWERMQPQLKRSSARAARKKKEVGNFRTANPLPERILGLFEQCPQELLDAGFDPDVLWSHDIGVDLQRDRITFPIRDVDGYLAAIVGRNRGNRWPKYKLYTDGDGGELTEMGYKQCAFNNRDLVWRCEHIYASAFVGGARPTIYVAEGYKAALWLVQHGYEMTGALMGSSITRPQRTFLERMGGTVVLCLDAGRAGVRGTYKIGYSLRGMDVRVLRYPDHTEVDLQPDDLSEEDLHQSIATTLSFPEWESRQPRALVGDLREYRKRFGPRAKRGPYGKAQDRRR